MSHPHFDLLHSPISGRILVEASAGTGKTYTIAALVVRLIVEKQLEIESILVVTFTEAATAELRDRIRRRLVEALELFTTCSGSDDFLLPLFQRSADRDDARRRLQRALISFDQAAIHTIHGFCQRILRDRAFEARALFDTELVTDLSDFEQQLADDFWRMRSTTFTVTFADYLLDKKFGPDRLYQLQRAARRTERILPDSPAPALGAAEKVCAAHLVHLTDIWSSERAAILADFLACAPGMRKGSFTPEKIQSWASELDLFFSVGSLWGGETGIAKFSAPQANKGKLSPSHPFFADCAAFAAAREELQDLCRASLLALQRDFLLWREVEAGKRKARQNLRTYDDLLSEVASAVTSPSGVGLLDALRASYQAILIDEFQDTDPIQYAIFGTLCPDSRRTLFLIGDPKQAIYSFRGADIFTYLAATRHVEYHYTLGVNYRSAPALVDAVSTLFARENPFLFGEIPYPEVQGSPKNSGIALIEGVRSDLKNPLPPGGGGLGWGGSLQVVATSEPSPSPQPPPVKGGGAESEQSRGGEVRPPLQLWFVDRPTGKAANKESSTERIVSAVAVEIVGLLNSGARLRTGAEERPLSAGDIAVLVRSNRQAAAVQEQLLACGVAAVRQGTESLFAAAEVEALLCTLATIADPGDTALARGALASGLLACDADALARSGDDPVILDSWLQRLRDYHELWARRGITSLSGALFAGEGLGLRCLTQPEGERRLTNLRHAFEVLHCAESREGLGMAGLLSWFSRQIADPPEGEEYQLRLETDERAVQVVTIHRSKGLEYPVCFVPFCWNGSQPSTKFKNSPFTFHAPSAGEPGELTLDLGTSAEERDEHRAINVREALAENLRLLYVAMTRAQARVYLVWGALAGAESSAPAWLLHGPETVDPGAEVAQTETRFKELDDGAIRERLLPLLANGAGEIVDLPVYPEVAHLHLTGAGHFELAPLPTPTVISNDWRLSSYSALVAGSTHLADGEAWKTTERVGDEGTARLVESIESGPTIHTFPRGADPGSCLHDIFEVIDFAAEEVEAGLIEKTLSAYAIDPSWSPVVSEMLWKVLHVPLDGADLQLSRISRRDRCSEMGFFLPLTALRAAGLAAIFRRHQTDLPDPRIVAMIAALNFETVSGMLRGFIDLVFTCNGRYYLIDWKSNCLGPNSAAYTPERMLAEMLSSGYVLQYHLYCVALHRHLRRTLSGYDYETHFGGVFYLFLRGVDGSGSTGVFRDRPTLALIEDLDHLFAGKEAL